MLSEVKLPAQLLVVIEEITCYFKRFTLVSVSKL
jgi:hypothetical protein